jgi:hypothetical protein
MHPVFPNERLRAARERLGKEPHQIARETGLQYYDMEDCDDELWMASSLRDIVKVCFHLNVTARSLFDPESREELPQARYTFGDIANLIRQHLEARSISAEEFGNRAGWGVDDILANAPAGWEWNVDCLKDVCGMIRVNWLDALPATKGNADV